MISDSCTAGDLQSVMKYEMNYLSAGNPVLVVTGDGSHTLLLPGLNEHYHSRHGAVAESRHVFVEAGFEAALLRFQEIRILEVGFGTGLNALLTFIRAEEKGIKVHYTGIEPYPPDPELIAELNYPVCIGHDHAPDWWQFIHATARWNNLSLSPAGISLLKWRGTMENFPGKGYAYNLIYFDAFAPAVQPALWEPYTFRKLAYMLEPEGILVTYSSKGEVRRAICDAGLRVEKLPGPAGKREMVRAFKI